MKIITGFKRNNLKARRCNFTCQHFPWIFAERKRQKSFSVEDSLTRQIPGKFIHKVKASAKIHSVIVRLTSYTLTRSVLSRLNSCQPSIHRKPRFIRRSWTETKVPRGWDNERGRYSTSLTLNSRPYISFSPASRFRPFPGCLRAVKEKSQPAGKYTALAK